MFILYAASEAETWSAEQIGIHCDIILGSSVREEKAVHLAMSKFEPDLVFRRQPVIASDGFTLGRAPDPGSDQASVIVVSAVILAVVVHAYAAERNWVGVSAFQAQVQF